MFRLPAASAGCIVTTAILGLAAGSTASADVSSFNTTLTPLSGSSFQLNDTFSILYDLDVAHLDLNGDNVPDQDVAIGFGDYLGDYLDPEHYIIDFALPGSGLDGKMYR